MDKSDPAYKDCNIYIAEQMSNYGVEFTSYLEPNFIQDMQSNKAWYKENTNQFLLNINYPSKLQTDFLKELELGQQLRNDKRY